MKALVGGRVILPNEIAANLVVLFAENIIDIMEEKNFSHDMAEEIIDARGLYVSPGFINIHIHGCGGSDVMDFGEASLQRMQELLPSTGVTAFLPTTMTYDFARIYGALSNVRLAMQSHSGARVLGAHMEGPFISEKFRGAQAAEHIMAADFSKLAPYSDVIRIITVAPENVADADFFAECKKAKIIVSMGHTAADYAVAKKAIEKGIRHATHIFNTYLPFNHREPGAIGAALDSDIACELIADNIHVHPMMQRLLYKAKGKDKIMLITDSMRACLLGDGESELGGQKVFVKNKEARLQNGALAGSILPMNEAVLNFWQNTNAPLYEAVRMAGFNQAAELGETDIGELSIGKKADIVLFDEKINVKQTFVNGKLVYNSK
jgi:N-acetylglucosamine-6-phosphate deacetylase